MNLQIFGTRKSADTRKAQRFFQERKLKFQFIDLTEKEMSRGEFDAVKRAVGSTEALITENERDAASIRYLALEEDRVQALLANPAMLLHIPIVRNGKAATVGYAPDVWKTWE